MSNRPQNEALGKALCAAGDLNSDGIPDVIFGVTPYDGLEAGSGAIVIVFLNRTGDVIKYRTIDDSVITALNAGEKYVMGHIL